jgi:hypothetical protein
MALNGATGANVIATTIGTVTRPSEISRTSAMVAPANITPRKHSTIFGLFIQTTSGSTLQPRIIAARGDSGHTLPIKHSRSYPQGKSNQSVAFAAASFPGSLSTDTTGASQTTGSYTARTTLVGDINGDGKVDYSDLQAFAPSYMARQGDSRYIAAADFNQNGIINLYDAKVLLHNMAPLTPRLPLTARLMLVPQDRIHYSGPTISGGATFSKVVTIVGHTTPGSLVIEDNHTARLPGGTQAYKFNGPAHATNAKGFFSITSTNTEGLNNNNFLIIDPFGHQLIIDFPVLWIPFATGHAIVR